MFAIKKKRKLPVESISTFNRLLFFLLWIVLTPLMASISHSIFLFLLDVISPVMGENFMRDSYWRMILLDAFLLIGLLAPVEKILLKWSFGQWIKGWMSSRILSTALSITPFIILHDLNLQALVMNNPQNMLQIALIGAIAALPQVWVLHRYVQKSWLYLIPATIASLMPIFIMPFALGSTLGASFTIGSSAALIALMMLWFFRQAPEETKPKRDESQRHQRLEDNASEVDESQDTYFEQEQHQALRFTALALTDN